MAIPLILLHGGAHGAWCWQPMLEQLATSTVAEVLDEIANRPES